MDLSRTPLSHAQVAALIALRIVHLWTDKNSGKIYVSRRYWNGITQEMRDALIRVAS